MKMTQYFLIYICILPTVNNVYRHISAHLKGENPEHSYIYSILTLEFSRQWWKKVFWKMVVTTQSLMVPSILTISHHHPSMTVLPLRPPQSLFFILPFFWPPRPKPDFLTSESHCLFLARSLLMPPPCRNCCFCCFLRCFRICCLVFSSERIVRPPGVCCGPAGLWRFGLWGLRPRRPRPRPRPGRQMAQQQGLKEKKILLVYFKGTCWTEKNSLYIA